MTDMPTPHPTRETVRMAAVGDLHLTACRAGRFRPALLRLPHHADLLLLAGDLTHRGTREQAAYLADELRDLGLPVVAVLGNHDHASGRTGAMAVADALADTGAIVLDDSATVLNLNGMRLGIAGTMGFGGGFDPSPADGRAAGFATALTGMDCDLRIALTHYAPTAATVAGEPHRLFTVLGSSALGAAVDTAGAHLAVHGHAHHGREHGTTPGGVAVRNVAYPVIRTEARIYHLRQRPDRTVEITTLHRDRAGAFVRWSTNRSVDLANHAAGVTRAALSAATTHTRKGARRG